MAEAMKIQASEIEGLEEVLTEIVRKEFARRPPREDIEELKRSPAGTVIRLEEQVQALTDFTKAEFQNIDRRFESIDKRFENIESRMVTEFGKIDERFEKIEAHLVQTDRNVLSNQEMIRTLLVKIDEQDKRFSIFQEGIDKRLNIFQDGIDKRLSTFQKVTYAFLGVLSSTLITTLILLIKLLLKH